MNNMSDPLISYYLHMIDKLNLTYLIDDLNDTDNSTVLKTILEDHFIWPADMR